ncbi:SEC-C metal-binding domain-containing protein [Burkholderia pseudomallei]|uniref:SEC-C metal-binding domain-containing protein n=1 Tax=Burkholderia pseudomallei TaxID=28450 RepID=UPI000F05E79A|nr:SEC-C metal-binding domain-containing protein [Burkholderia pseudomallei]
MCSIRTGIQWKSHSPASWYTNRCPSTCGPTLPWGFFCSSQIPIRATKLGRNEPCHCGSGRKYKKCCLS